MLERIIILILTIISLLFHSGCYSNQIIHHGCQYAGETVNIEAGDEVNLTNTAINTTKKLNVKAKKINLKTEQSIIDEEQTGFGVGVGPSMLEDLHFNHSERDAKLTPVAPGFSATGESEIVTDHLHMQGGVINTPSGAVKATEITHENVHDHDHSSSVNLSVSGLSELGKTTPIARPELNGSTEFGYSSRNFEATNRATIDENTTVETESDISGLNRDASQSRVVTRDDASEFLFYSPLQVRGATREARQEIMQAHLQRCCKDMGDDYPKAQTALTALNQEINSAYANGMDEDEILHMAENHIENYNQMVRQEVALKEALRKNVTVDGLPLENYLQNRLAADNEQNNEPAEITTAETKKEEPEPGYEDDKPSLTPQQRAAIENFLSNDDAELTFQRVESDIQEDDTTTESRTGGNDTADSNDDDKPSERLASRLRTPRPAKECGLKIKDPLGVFFNDENEANSPACDPFNLNNADTTYDSISNPTANPDPHTRYDQNGNPILVLNPENTHTRPQSVFDGVGLTKAQPYVDENGPQLSSTEAANARTAIKASLAKDLDIDPERVKINDDMDPGPVLTTLLGAETAYSLAQLGLMGKNIAVSVLSTFAATKGKGAATVPGALFYALSGVGGGIALTYAQRKAIGQIKDFVLNSTEFGAKVQEFKQHFAETYGDQMVSNKDLAKALCDQGVLGAKAIGNEASYTAAEGLIKRSFDNQTRRFTGKMLNRFLGGMGKRQPAMAGAGGNGGGASSGDGGSGRFNWQNLRNETGSGGTRKSGGASGSGSSGLKSGSGASGSGKSSSVPKAGGGADDLPAPKPRRQRTKREQPEQAQPGLDNQSGNRQNKGKRETTEVAGIKVKKGEQPWNVRPGQEWKKKIIGKAQVTGTKKNPDLAHARKTYKHAIKEAKKPETKFVLLDRGHNRVPGVKIKSNRRPDALVGKKGRDGKLKVHPHEVASKTDSLANLEMRNEEALRKLPKGMAGKYTFTDYNGGAK